VPCIIGWASGHQGKSFLCSCLTHHVQMLIAHNNPPIHHTWEIYQYRKHAVYDQGIRSLGDMVAVGDDNVEAGRGAGGGRSVFTGG